MLRQIEIQKLKDYVRTILKDDYDLFDTEQEIDHEINFQENKTILHDKLKPFIKKEDNPQIKYELEQDKRIQEQQEKEKIIFENKWLSDTNPLQKKYLEEFRTIAVYGDLGTGKTAIAYRIIQELQPQKTFFIKHPKPELIKKMGYANLKSLEQIEQLHDCIIYWDEPQLTTSIYDHKTNMIIARACSLARQRNITLIISSSDTRIFTKHNEAFFSLWIIKDVDYTAVKNGSKIKKAIKDNSIIDPEGYKIETNEYLTENRLYPEINGKHTFNLPQGWTEQYSKAYK